MDNDKLITKLQTEMTLKYVMALFLIAALSSFTFYMLYSVLKESHNTGELVNISGKQRMLSQHIALNAHRIHNIFTNNTNNQAYTYSYASKTLKSQAKEMFYANKKLSSANLSSALKSMYFGDMNLAKRVEDYVSLAHKVASTKEHDILHPLLYKIDELSEPLLIDLNQVVLQYQKEGEEKLENIQFMEIFAWIATIVMLLLEVIFIFQPMIRKIISLKIQNDSVLEHLEDTIAIRTMHLEKTKLELAHLASHDPLTGLRNRLNLEKDIENTIEKSKKNGATFGMLMFDIDWFKTVNDEYGHDVGDLVLKEISSIFLSSVREGDKVYRAGGEEFVILFNRITYDNELLIAQKIRKLVQSHIFNINGAHFSKTISCGFYHSSIVEVQDYHHLFKLVDKALYKAKTDGRNRVTKVSV